MEGMDIKTLKRSEGDCRLPYPEWIGTILSKMNQADVNRLAAMVIISNVTQEEGSYRLSDWLQFASNRVPVLIDDSDLVEALVVAESNEILTFLTLLNRTTV